MKPFKKAVRAWHYLKRHGLRATLKKIRHILLGGLTWRDPYTAKKLREQRTIVLPDNVTVSILTPLYNTPLPFLREMIESVIRQTYSHWELCLVDGSDDAHGYVGHIAAEYAGCDPRIRYQKLERNLGISQNTNACIEMSCGEYLALLDHDDVLHPAALFEVVQCICKQRADVIYTDEAVFRGKKKKAILSLHYKPDFGIDTLRSVNYICHLTVFSKALLEKVGRFNPELDGSQDHDMILRLTEQARCIVHIPRILYFWRAHKDSVASDISAKSYAPYAGHRAVLESIRRSGMQGYVESTEQVMTFYRIHYNLPTLDRVSIIIPSKDHFFDLQACIRSIIDKTTYPNYEIVIVDNGSTDEAVSKLYQELEKDARIRICRYDAPFHYPKINHLGTECATGTFYLFLNNDTEVITPQWIEEMMMFAQRSDVGAVGAMLYYTDNTVQHGGVVVGIGGYAGHAFRGFRRGEHGFLGRLLYAQNCSAVTAACMLIRASVFREVGGFDEQYAIACNDVDLCLKIRQAGYLIVWTPFAELYHRESRSRGYEDTPEKMERFAAERALFQTRWEDVLRKGDPYYNVNLTPEREDFSPRD